MTHSHPAADGLWLVGTVFFVVLVLAGTLVPLWAALFFRPVDPPTRLERWLQRFGAGLLVLALVVVGAFAVGFGVVVVKRVWALA